MPKPPLPPEYDEFLAQPNPAVIVTLMPDGSPNSVATWYIWENGRILVNMDEGRARLEWMRRDPRVALTIIDGENWYRHVSLRGRIVSLEDDADLSDIDRLSQRYLGHPYRNRERGRVSAWIEVTDWHAWNGG